MYLKEDKKIIIGNSFLISLFAVLLFLLSWEALVIFGALDMLYVGQPTGILLRFLGLSKNKEISLALSNTLWAVALGYTISILLGSFLGFISGINKQVYYFLRPLFFSIQTIPAIVFLPLFALWFGAGFEAKVVIIVTMSIGPIIINTYQGVRETDENLIKMAISFGANKFFIFRNIMLFQSLPYILAGAKSSVGKALIAVILAEFYGFGRGLGYYLSYYGATYKINDFMAVIMIIILFNMLLLFVINLLNRSTAKWKND